MIHVTCVHQSVEMYGSDKSFAAAVLALSNDDRFTPNVILPDSGPLLDHLGDVDVAIEWLWVLRKANLLWALTLGLPRNITSVVQAARRLRSSQLVYVNTAVVLSYLFSSILTGRRLIVHVREIPTGLAMRVLRRLLVTARAHTIFNSKATADAFCLPADQPQAVIFNGFTAKGPVSRTYNAQNRPLNILCIGRLNSWKGQEVLLEAITLLPQSLRQKLAVRIVGGVYKTQEHFRTRLQEQVNTKHLHNIVTLVDFVEEPRDEYLQADIVVVPSTRPEPFGRVAIEAMAYGCAVIAANHGGLTEIVKHDVTGKLVNPSDPASLAKAISDYINSPELVETHGRAGQDHFVHNFTQDACDRALCTLLASWARTLIQ